MEKEFLMELGIDEVAADTILARHGQELDHLQFTHQLEDAIFRAGGRSVKAICALLDVDAIRASEDRAAATTQALKALKKESAYLFAGELPPPYAVGTGASQAAEDAPQTRAGALKERFRQK